MTPKKEDRRVTRTKNLLRNALIELILEKGYGAITVQDILDRADVGRSTFYAHFNSKDDLLVGDAPYFHIIMEDIQEAGAETELIPSFLDMFEHVAEQRLLFRALVADEGGNLVQQAVRKHLQTTFAARFNRLTEQGRDIPFSPTVLAHYLTGGLMGLLGWWLDAENPCAPAEINEMFVTMARKTVVI